MNDDPSTENTRYQYPTPTFALYLRSTLFYLGYYGSGILHGTLAPIIGLVLPFKGRYQLIMAWNHFVLWWLRITCNIRVHVEGREHIPKDQPCVVLAKHQTTWETLYLQLLFQPLCTIVKKELLSIPFFGWGLAMLRPIAINREQKRESIKQLMQQGKERLEEGLNVLIFPEGTRVYPGERRSYARSGVELATKNLKPIVAVAHNAGIVWPNKRYCLYPGVINLHIKYFYYRATDDSKQLCASIAEWIEINSRHTTR